MRKTIAVVLAALLVGQVARAEGWATNCIPSQAELALLNQYTNSRIESMGGWSVSASSLVEIRLAEGGRMTRPVETVSVVTNVTTEIGKPCPGCTMWGTQQGNTYTPGHDYISCPENFLPRDTKRETTEVIEIKTLRFKWIGEECVVERKRVLSKNVRRWVRKDDWSEE